MYIHNEQINRIPAINAAIAIIKTHIFFLNVSDNFGLINQNSSILKNQFLEIITLNTTLNLLKTIESPNKIKKTLRKIYLNLCKIKHFFEEQKIDAYIDCHILNELEEKISIKLKKKQKNVIEDCICITVQPAKFDIFLQSETIGCHHHQINISELEQREIKARILTIQNEIHCIYKSK